MSMYAGIGEKINVLCTIEDDNLIGEKINVLCTMENDNFIGNKIDVMVIKLMSFD